MGAGHGPPGWGKEGPVPGVNQGRLIVLPCGPSQPGIGLDAVNDALLLEACIYRLLKAYCRDQPYYLNLIELFLQVHHGPGLPPGVGVGRGHRSQPPRGILLGPGKKELGTVVGAARRVSVLPGVAARRGQGHRDELPWGLPCHFWPFLFVPVLVWALGPRANWPPQPQRRPGSRAILVPHHRVPIRQRLGRLWTSSRRPRATWIWADTLKSGEGW